MAPLQDATLASSENLLDQFTKQTNPKEILYDGYYYNVTNFIRRHPGGRQIINNFTGAGEDATLPIQQFHSRSMSKVQGIMKSLKRRPVTDVAEKYDQKTREKNKALTEDFTKLYLELKAEGLFEPSYFHISYRIIEMILYGSLGFYLITTSQNVVIKFLGGILLCLCQSRALGLMHEAGHLSLTGNPKLDRILHTFIHGCVLGQSAIYWRRFHSYHHAQTARVKHDLDFETLPWVVLNTKVMDDMKKDQNFVIRNPMYFAPIVSLLALLYIQIWEVCKSLFKYRIPSEILAVGIYYVLAWQVGFWPMFIISFVVSQYFVINTSLNHTHLPMTTEPTHWVEQSFLHTVDIEHRPWCDWWMFYLNYQIEHHLFPTMPQFRNRLAVDRVRALAEKHGLPYRVYSYKAALMKVTKNVFNIAKELKEIHNE